MIFINKTDFFTCITLNATTAANRLSNLSKIAYVELIDSLDKQVAAAKIGLHSGTGNGSVLLSPSVSSGSYKLRAYTAWMKNGSPDDFFEKNITLINIQKLTVNGKGDAESGNSAPDLQSNSSSNNNQQHNNDTLALVMTGAKQEYNTREKVTLALAATNLKDSFDSAFLSLFLFTASIHYNL